MNATTPPTIESSVLFTHPAPMSRRSVELEPLEEEFRPESQAKAVTTIVGVSFAIVVGLVSLMLGWYYGAFFVIAMIVKRYLAKAEMAEALTTGSSVQVHQVTGV